MNGNPIAYTYEADHHCPDCTLTRFGHSTDNYHYPPETATDREGNSIGAVAPWDEWWNVGEGPQTLACSDCGRGLDDYKD